MPESPTFVAHFADGEVTRMTTVTPPIQFDVGRGVRLARAAYRSRKKLEPLAPTPVIVDAWFERRGEILKTYDADALAAASEE